MFRYRRLFSLYLFCMVIGVSQEAYALRCNGGLITVGDAKLTVEKKCGEPTWVDRWGEQIVALPDTDFERSISRINERWIYNFGPTRFLRIISFRDGKVTHIDTGSRGFTVVPGMQRCDFSSLSLGDTSAEIRALCGAPDQQEQRFETLSRPIEGGRQQVSVSVDEWTYNLGPTRFMRVLTFRNGMLTNIETGDRGFN